MKICTKCGTQCSDIASRCPRCKELFSPQGNSNNPVVATTCLRCGNTYVGQSCNICGASARLARRRKKGCLFATIVVVVIIVAFTASFIKAFKTDIQTSVGSSSINSASSEQKAKDDLKAFDKRTWEIFKQLYTAHNVFMSSLDAYGNGSLSKVKFYDYCKKVEKYWMDVPVDVKTGTNDTEKEYLSVFSDLTLADQMAAKDLMKYLDSNKTSDLSKANSNIQRAVECFTMIASNRVILLRQAGYDEAEIEEITNAIIQELEELDKKK